MNNQLASQRLQELLDMGNILLKSNHRDSSGKTNEYKVESTLSAQFQVSSLSCLERIFSRNGVHFVAFTNCNSLDYKFGVQRAIGVLNAAKDDYDNGYLFSMKSLIEAEVFDDFLEQAEQLFAKGYHAPAAVVAGCVLEDGLKKLCAKNGIVLASKATMNPANDELAKKGVYNTLMQKKVLAMADLRNKAAHGQWTEFTKEDVGDMIKSVRSFLETHYV